MQTRTRTHRLTACLRSSGLWLSACLAEAAVILILSVVPSVEGGINSGTAAHCLAYGTLSCTTGIFLLINNVPHSLIKGALLAALYGACMELLQYCIPYRSCQFGDVVVNCLAALAGMALAGMLRSLVTPDKKP